MLESFTITDFITANGQGVAIPIPNKGLSVASTIKKESISISSISTRCLCNVARSPLIDEREYYSRADLLGERESGQLIDYECNVGISRVAITSRKTC